MAKSKIYFGKETELAIRDYIKCENEAEKELIYLRRIMPAFLKLTENIVNMPRFNFKKMGSFTSLQDEVMAHLYSNISKFNPKKRSKKSNKKVKAFSYFGTVAKNYLVQKSMKRAKVGYLNENVEGSEIPLDNNLMLSVNDENISEMSEFLSLLVENFELKRDGYSEDKKKVADAIIYFMKNVQKEAIFCKKHLYLLLREYSGLNSKTITQYLKEFKIEYNSIKKDYYNGNL
jgi:hypothetical protein